MHQIKFNHIVTISLFSLSLSFYYHYHYHFIIIIIIFIIIIIIIIIHYYHHFELLFPLLSITDLNFTLNSGTSDEENLGILTSIRAYSNIHK